MFCCLHGLKPSGRHIGGWLALRSGKRVAVQVDDLVLQDRNVRRVRLRPLALMAFKLPLCGDKRGFWHQGHALDIGRNAVVIHPLAVNGVMDQACDSALAGYVDDMTIDRDNRDKARGKLAAIKDFIGRQLVPHHLAALDHSAVLDFRAYLCILELGPIILFAEYLAGFDLNVILLVMLDAEVFTNADGILFDPGVMRGRCRGIERTGVSARMLCLE